MPEQDIDLLIKELNCDEIIRCQKARRALVAIGHRAVPALLEAMGSKKRWVRWEAAKALAQIGDPSAAPPLIKALKDREFDVRWLAAEGLISIGEPALVPLLKAIIDDSKSVWLLRGAHHVLHDMHRGNLDSILQPVMTALDNLEPALEAPIAARRALDAIQARRS